MISSMSRQAFVVGDIHDSKLSGNQSDSSGSSSRQNDSGSSSNNKRHQQQGLLLQPELSSADAAKAVDCERLRLGLTISQYAARKKDASGGGSKGWRQRQQQGVVGGS